jgi:3-methyladenine DNA glycosylase/8-oxoguanine DNA glycosylase
MCHVCTAMAALIAVREPYDWERVLDWLGTRAIPGLEAVEEGVYRRFGEAEVRRVEGGIEFTGAADPAVVARVFDTAHDPAALGGDPLFARAPGIRVPGAWSGWELAVRAVLGQQVSVAGARRTAEKLVGEERRFPAPEAVADGPLPGMPKARERALRALAEVVAGGLRLDPPLDIPATRAALLGLPGFGPWTVEYIAMRALRDPDAWPGSDLWLRRAADAADAERWRPWRAYAAMVLWQTA